MTTFAWLMIGFFYTIQLSSQTSAMAMGRPFDLPYSVEVCDDSDQHIEELIALTGDYGVARAAYDEAIKRRTGKTVTLRQKARVLADSRRER